jgi:uncharacterized protein YceK
MGKIFEFFALLIVLATVCVMSGCGKVSDIEPYEGSGYPHSYPRR